jgi:hypothetical protein
MKKKNIRFNDGNSAGIRLRVCYDRLFLLWNTTVKHNVDVANLFTL